MTQKLAEKVEAIQSLLGFLFAHLDHVPGAAKTARQEWESEPSPLDEPKKPVVLTECTAHCDTCLAYHATKGVRPSCPDELWKREYRALRKRYRIVDLEDALLRLGEADIHMAQAVWAVFVEPWPGELCLAERPALGTRTETIGIEVRLERARLAEDGVKWLAEHVDGDVRGYGAPQQKLRPVVTDRDREIVRLRIAGKSYGQIVEAVGCSKSTVKAVLSGQKVRRGRTIFAGSS